MSYASWNFKIALWKERLDSEDTKFHLFAWFRTIHLLCTISYNYSFPNELDSEHIAVLRNTFSFETICLYLYRQTGCNYQKGKGWCPIYRFNPAEYLFLSQVWTMIHCHMSASFICSMIWDEGYLLICWCWRNC